MQDLIFYDFDFNRLIDVRKYISVSYTVNYCGYGSFEAHFPLTDSDLIETLQKNDYLICTHGRHSAVINGWRIEEDIAIFGNTPEWLMTKRAVKEFSVTDSPPPEIAWAVVSSAMGDFVTVQDSFPDSTPTEYSSSGVRTVYDIVCEVLKGAGLGFSLCADITEKAFVFRVYSGKTQPVIISPSNKSAHSMVFTRELQSMATNSGWYKCSFTDMGGWDAISNSPFLAKVAKDNAFRYYRIVSPDSTQMGLECRTGSYIYSDSPDGTLKVSDTRPEPVWVYADNPNVCGAKKWDCIIPGTNSYDEALLKIESLTATDTFETDVRRLEYGKDYMQGDIVKVQFEAGSFRTTLLKQISGVQIFYDVDTIRVCPILSD